MEYWGYLSEIITFLLPDGPSTTLGEVMGGSWLGWWGYGLDGRCGSLLAEGWPFGVGSLEGGWSCLGDILAGRLKRRGDQTLSRWVDSTGQFEGRRLGARMVGLMGCSGLKLGSDRGCLANQEGHSCPWFLVGW
jgi:hypothetical protein